MAAGWTTYDTLLSFVIAVADVDVLVPGIDGWLRATNIKQRGVELLFRVQGCEWDVSMRDAIAVRFTLKQERNK